MTTPSVVEKQLIDIELKSGQYETERAERADWTKKLTTVENLVLDEYGCLVKRPGLTNTLTYLDENGAAMGIFNHRLLPLQDGLMNVGNGFVAYHLDESAAQWRKKQKLPEYGVRHTVVGSNSKNPSALYSVSSDAANTLTGVAATSRYIVSCYGVSSDGVTSERFNITLTDRESGQTIRLYRVESAIVGTITVVDDRYIHVAMTLSTGAIYYHVIDTLALASDAAAVTPTLLAATAAGSYVLTLIPVTNYALLVRYDAAGNAVVDKIDNSGVVAATGTYAGVPVGAGANATDVYVCIASTGTVVGFDIATLAVVTPRVLTNWMTGNPPHMLIAVNAAGDARIVASHQQISTGSAGNLAQAAVYSLAAGATALVRMGALHGWVISAHPWHGVDTDRFYLNVAKQRCGQNGATVTRETVGANVVADITYGSIQGDLSNPQYNARFRPVAVLDGYVAQANLGLIATTNGESAFRAENGPPIQRAFTYGNSTFLGVPSLSTASSRSYAVAEMSLYDTTCLHIAGQSISGGCMSTYDGFEVAENGFVDSPSVWHTQVAGALAAGSRNYVAVYEYLDDDGNVHYSRVSAVSSAVNTGAQLNRIEIPTPSISAHNGVRPYGGVASRTACKLYRTTSGGTVYYLVTTFHDSSNTNTYGTYDDSLSDASLVARPQLFRQPGIQNAALDRYYAPASRHIVQHKDRLFICRGSTVFYSSFAVDGEAPWFSPAFSFPVPGGTGDITGLASMDGMLVVFKRDGIWIVDGDGPPENGGSGMEFSPPRRILTEYGCISTKSIVATPDGIMYRSGRGFELLTRAFSVADPWVGEAVKDTADLYPVVSGSAFDRNGGRVLFTIGAAYSYDGQVNTLAAGVTLAYDIAVKAWTVFKTTNGLGTYATALQDVVFAKASAKEKLYFLDGYYYVFNEDDTTGADLSSYWAPFKIETAWVRATSMQDRIRVSDFLFLGKRQSPHNLKISVAYDYSDTYSYSKTWTPADLADVEQLELQIPKQAVQAVRFKIEDEIPADLVTYPLGNGKGPEILCLSVKLGLRGGGAKLPAGNKG